MLEEIDIKKLMKLKITTLLSMLFIQNLIIIYAITKDKKHFKYHKDLITDIINKN